MGAVSSVASFVADSVGSVANAVGDVVGGAVDAVKDVGSSVDDFVNNEIPGGWVTAAVIAAPYVAPELFAAEAAVPAAAEATSMPVFSEIMELPTDQLLSEYAAATSAVPAAVETASAPVAAPEPVLPDVPPVEVPTMEAVQPAAVESTALPTEVQDPFGYVPSEREILSGAPVEDLSTYTNTPIKDSIASDTLLGGLAGGALGVAGDKVLTDALAPDFTPPPTFTPKTYTPDFNAKFAQPEAWKLLDTPEFQLSDTVTNPYLTKTEDAPLIGGLLGAGSGPYKSNLIAALRDASATPAWVNPGFVSFQSK